MLNRRDLLLVGLAAGLPGMPLLMKPHARAEAATPMPVHGPHGAQAVAVRQAIRPFSRRMPVSPQLRPVASAGAHDFYLVPIRPSTAEILPGVRTPVLTYGGSFPGPTIRARTDRPAIVVFGNRTDHPVNVHLHGGHTAAEHDGHPMDLIEPGRHRMYAYRNRQQGATLWYHDHSHHTEAEHVYRGLHGAYIVEDPEEDELRLPSGRYDVPIMLRDCAFDAQGNLVFDPFAVPDRTTVLANGVPSPYFPVAARKYRFRLVNCATERVFALGLGVRSLTVIGTDGGLLPAPVEVAELALGSGERADIVIDFSGYPIGSTVALTDAVAGEILRFDVTHRAPDRSRVPATLRPLPPMPPATVRRTVDMGFAMVGEDFVGVVNGKPFDADRVDFTVKRGDTETWTVTSSDPPGLVHHPFHMHLTQFRVLERDGRPPAPHEAGLKDTITFTSGETVRVQATFRDYLGRYAFHCHFLEHSAFGMMAQMEVVP